MSARDHASYQEEIGAYLLGALTDSERQALEQHMEGCVECREEVERLRPAADALPGSVEQVEPPPSLKASLMEIVEREAGERSGAPSRPSVRERLRLPRMGGMRLAFTGAALALGLAIGFGVAQLGADGSARTVVATVDEGRVPDAGGDLWIEGEGKDGAILRVRGLPPLRGGRVYQAWVQRDSAIVPQPTFEVGANGRGAVAVPGDLSNARAVLVSREPRGGSLTPSEAPILTVQL